MTEFQTYDDRTKLWHWLSAGLIVAMWLIVQSIDFFPRELRIWPLSAHVTIGALLVLVYFARIQWRLTQGRKLPPADTGLIGFAGTAAHYALYLLIGIVLALGLTLEAVRGDFVLHLIHIPSIAPGDTALRRTVNDYHGLAANMLLILAGVHASAALWHHFIKHDGVLRRMLGRG